eukprot:sb/3477278/
MPSIPYQITSPSINNNQLHSTGLSWPVLQLPSILTDDVAPTTEHDVQLATTTEEPTPAGDLEELMKTTPVSIHGYTLRPTPGIFELGEGGGFPDHPVGVVEVILILVID